MGRANRAVVGCSECDNLWVIKVGDSETVSCTRCGTRHDAGSLKHLATGDRPSMVEARSRLLKERARE